MDKKRLEEFRKKLRQGKSVRVVNGQIQLDDEPTTTTDTPATKPAAAPARPARAPRAQGVQVKPHEWGSAQPLVATPEGQVRALKEQQLLSREYPDFEMDMDEDGLLYVHGWIGPSPQLTGRYHVIVSIPPGYGRGVMPRGYVLEPSLRRGAPHLYSDGSLCLDHSGAFDTRSTLVTFLAWATVWLTLYEGWVETGKVW